MVHDSSPTGLDFCRRVQAGLDGHGLAFDLHRGPSQGDCTLFQGLDGQHQARVTAGTAMEHSKLPLTSWALASHLISHAKTGMSALAPDETGGSTHLQHGRFTGLIYQVIGMWAKTRLKPGCAVPSDGPVCFADVNDAGCIHLPRVAGTRKPKDPPEFKWINTVLDKLKTMLPSAIHGLKYRKYGKTCPAAFAYRFDRRFDLRGLMATLIADVARIKPVPEKVVSWGHAEAASKPCNYQCQLS
jgi:hypothetical protein